MWLPSLRKKLRTQPTWSAGSLRSMRDSPTAGCQALWLLKSRSTAQTRSIGASMTAERLTRITQLCFRNQMRPEKRPADVLREVARAGAQSNSAHHSAKVRLPSVTGVSLSVAT